MAAVGGGAVDHLEGLSFSNKHFMTIIVSYLKCMVKAHNRVLKKSSKIVILFHKVDFIIIYPLKYFHVQKIDLNFRRNFSC